MQRQIYRIDLEHGRKGKDTSWDLTQKRAHNSRSKSRNIFSNGASLSKDNVLMVKKTIDDVRNQIISFLTLDVIIIKSYTDGKTASHEKRRIVQISTKICFSIHDRFDHDSSLIERIISSTFNQE